MPRGRHAVCAVPHGCFLFQRYANCVFTTRYPSGSSVMKLTFIRSQSLRAGSRSYSTATRLPAEPCLLRVRERAGRCLGKIGARGQQRAPPEQPKSENEKCKSDWQTRIYRADK
jgi:hypothetical protein